MRFSRKTFAIVMTVVGVAVLTGGLYYAWLITPPPMPETAEEGLATIGSSRYQRLPEYRKAEYLTRTRELMGNLSDEQRRAMFERRRTDESIRDSMREVRRDMMRQRIVEFARAAPHERKKILDQAIDMQEAMRQRMDNRPRPERTRGEGGGDRSNRGDRGDRRGRMRDHIQNRIEQGNPQMGAMRMEFFKEMRERREERGLPNRGPGGGRPGRG